MSVFYKPHQARVTHHFRDHEGYGQNQKIWGKIRNKSFTATTDNYGKNWTVKIHKVADTKNALFTLTGTDEQTWREVTAEAAEATRPSK